jgi:hypothetical protein
MRQEFDKMVSRRSTSAAHEISKLPRFTSDNVQSTKLRMHNCLLSKCCFPIYQLDFATILGDDEHFSAGSLLSGSYRFLSLR